MRDHLNSVVEAEPVELPELVSKPEAAPIVARRVEVVRDVPVKASAVLGRAALTVEKLFALKAGEVLELDQSIDAPIELRVEGHIVAYGQIVVVGDQFGVLVTHIGDQ